MQCTLCREVLPEGATRCPACSSPASENAPTTLRYGVNTETRSYDEDIPFIDAVSSTQTATTYKPESTRETDQRLPSGDAWTQPESTLTQGSALPPKRALSAGILAILTILIALLVMEGGAFSYYATILGPADLHTQATSVAQAFLTAQVQSTAKANSQATATTSAMTPAKVYQQATSGTAVLDDALTSPGSATWLQYGTATARCVFEKGAYHLQLSEQTNMFCPAFNGAIFNNVALQAQVMIVQGADAGLIFRIDNTLSSFYEFDYNTQGSYSFFLFKQHQGITLQTGYSSAIITGYNHPNLLTVIARNNHIYLYINKQPVAQLIDATYTSGYIGLSAGNSSGSRDIAFNNVKVWEL